MTTSISLLDWILSLFRDPAAREAFRADPRGYAADHGFERLSAADVHDVLCLHADDHSEDVHLPPPRDYDHDEDGNRYLEHYVNHYEIVEKHETTIDNSVHQHIDTGGGDFTQVIDNDPVVASGDGAVAAGGDIRDSAVTSGDGNVVGDGNQAVAGDDNDTAFGTGDATGAQLDYASFGQGAAVSLGGYAAGYAADNETDTDLHAAGSHTSVEDHSYVDSHDVAGSFNDGHDVDIHSMDGHDGDGPGYDGHDYDGHLG